MEILDIYTSNRYRAEYINSFVDTKCDTYINNINLRKKYIDGYCYDAYLWDCLKKVSVESEEQCMDILKSYENLLVLWDIHSCEKILIPNYWKFPKESVVKLSYDEYVNNQSKFIEDVYFFDDTFSWSVILTHEYVSQNRFCYLCWK